MYFYKDCPQLMSDKGETRRYQELDALRGIAALLVLFFHFTIWRPEAKLGFNLGNTGVHLFFIISGFVIFMSLSKVKSGIEFVINRFSRLYPAYWAAVTLTFVARFFYCAYINPEGESVSIGQYFGNLTMFQFYLGIPNIDDQYWTLMVEMLFYIFVLLLFQSKLLKHIEVIGITLSILAILLANLCWNASVGRFFHYMQLLKYFPLFFSGILFYKLYTQKEKPLKNYALVLLCLLCNLSLYKSDWYIFISFKEYAGMIILYFLLFFLFVNNRLNFIVNPVTIFLGKISYSLYLIHNFISVGLLVPVLVDTWHLNFWFASLGIVLPVNLLIASFVNYVVEVPLGAKIKTKLFSIVSKA